jgi:hypothetical protein
VGCRRCRSRSLLWLSVVPRLAEVPRGKELEDFVAALLQSTGRVIHGAFISICSERLFGAEISLPAVR